MDLPPLAPLAAPPSDVYNSPVVSVKVGPEATIFHIHRDLLCHYSSYFRAALASGFKEADTREIVLDDESTEVFQVFVEFLYTRELCDTKLAEPLSHYRQKRTDVILTQTELTKVWIFGDRRGIPILQNRAMDLLKRRVLQSLQYTYDLDLVYSNTIKGSKLRQFMTVVLAGYMPGIPQGWTAWCQPHTPELMADLIEEFYHIKSTVATYSMDNGFFRRLSSCNLYVHEG